jgi:hypothetical protein
VAIQIVPFALPMQAITNPVLAAPTRTADVTSASRAALDQHIRASPIPPHKATLLTVQKRQGEPAPKVLRSSAGGSTGNKHLEGGDLGWGSASTDHRHVIIQDCHGSWAASLARTISIGRAVHSTSLLRDLLLV